MGVWSKSFGLEKSDKLHNMPHLLTLVSFLAIFSGLFVEAGDIFRCFKLSKGVEKCLEFELSCSSLFEDEVCDGYHGHCDQGQDEEKQLCEDINWKNVRCHHGYSRCVGHRPGQCVRVEKVCDGVYDCIDRRYDQFSQLSINHVKASHYQTLAVMKQTALTWPLDCYHKRT